MNRIVLVPKGLTFKKRTQTRVAGRYVPRYNKATVAGGKKTAFRHTRYRKLEYRKRIFQFRITRDDGTIIDETTLRYYGQGINIYQKKDEYPNPTEVWHLRMVGSAHGRDEKDPDDLQYWTKNGDVWNYKDDSDPEYITEFSYNTITKIWMVPFYKWNKPTGNKQCFVRFICDDSVNAWYKKPTGVDPEYVYKTADIFKDEDLIKPKFYEIAVPIWRVAYENNRPAYVDYDEFRALSCADKIVGIVDKPHFYTSTPVHYTTQNPFYKKVIVESSIPYKITESLNCSSGQFISSLGYDEEGVYGDCPAPAPLCLAYGASTRFYGEELDVILETDDVWVSTSEEYIITPVEVEEKTFTINADITAWSGAYHASCWEWPEGIFHEKDVTVDWYRFSGTKREISSFISIVAVVVYT